MAPVVRGVIALVGRANVGKSTLFNRFLRENRSIVHDRPGVTRDRLYGLVWEEGENESSSEKRAFVLVDTGGYDGEFLHAENVEKHMLQAVGEADLVIFLLDGQSGLLAQDLALMEILRRKNKIVLPVVNKMDGQKADLSEFYRLGFEEVFPISALHGRGLRTLREAVEKRMVSLPRQKSWERTLSDNSLIRIAVLGRPNVGKSSLLNRLLGEERMIVSPQSGTTRDSCQSQILYHGRTCVFVDTAGVRRKSKIDDAVEVKSSLKSLQAMDDSHVVVYMIDAALGLADQDSRLIQMALQRGKPVLLVVNKWDLIPEKNSQTAKNYADTIRRVILRDVKYLPIHFISCLKQQRVHDVLDWVLKLSQQSCYRASTSAVNTVLRETVASHSPQLIKKLQKRIKFYYATQVAVQPPTLVIKCNVPGEVSPAYKRFLSQRFREKLGYGEVPLKILWRDRSPGETFEN